MEKAIDSVITNKLINTARWEEIRIVGLTLNASGTNQHWGPGGLNPPPGGKFWNHTLQIVGKRLLWKSKLNQLTIVVIVTSYFQVRIWGRTGDLHVRPTIGVQCERSEQINFVSAAIRLALIRLKSFLVVWNSNSRNFQSESLITTMFRSITGLGIPTFSCKFA